MKIISGDKKGANLKTRKGLETRPLLARVKKSLFSILAPDIENSVFLDLFAGNGGVGIEALSRGAKYCYFVDINNECVKIIRENLINLRMTDKSSVFRMDFRKAIKVLERDNVKIDICFIGAPYDSPFAIKALEILSEAEIFSPNAKIIAETRKQNLSSPSEIGNLKLYRKEKYGDTLLNFYQFNIIENAS